jgi:hypothetical protein
MVHPKMTIPPLPIKKIANKFQKNIKFGLLIDFDMQIRLSGLDQSFLA